MNILSLVIIGIFIVLELTPKTNSIKSKTRKMIENNWIYFRWSFQIYYGINGCKYWIIWKKDSDAEHGEQTAD